MKEEFTLVLTMFLVVVFPQIISVQGNLMQGHKELQINLSSQRSNRIPRHVPKEWTHFHHSWSLPPFSLFSPIGNIFKEEDTDKFILKKNIENIEKHQKEMLNLLKKLVSKTTSSNDKRLDIIDLTKDNMLMMESHSTKNSKQSHFQPMEKNKIENMTELFDDKKNETSRTIVEPHDQFKDFFPKIKTIFIMEKDKNYDQQPIHENFHQAQGNGTNTSNTWLDVKNSTKNTTVDNNLEKTSSHDSVNITSLEIPRIQSDPRIETNIPNITENLHLTESKIYQNTTYISLI